jgi:ribosomal protein S18 acetylase RimI-like enzyme
MMDGVVDVVTEIEETFVAHWSIFGRWTHGELHDENGVLWFETPIKHLPYNAVIRTRIDGDADAVVAAVLERFTARGVQFFWLVHPSAWPRDLSDRLAAHGLQSVENATGMSLELAGWKGADLPSGVVYREVLTDADLHEFHKLTTVYWEIPEDEAPLVARFQREWGPGRAPGHRYLALVDDVPVAKGYLSLAGPPGVAAIYAMTTLPEARGRGIASGLTTVLISRASELGCRRVVLHSSDMVVGVYRRVGFVERCRFTVFATAALWSQAH